MGGQPEGALVVLRDHFDSKRQRPLPVAEYSPAGSPRGLLVFSVGFGGTRQSYGFLARAWSASGFLVVVVEHVGSNLQVLKELQREAPGRHADLSRRIGEKVKEPHELLARPADLQWIVDNYAGDLPYALAGHSFGAYTVCAAAGCTLLISGSRIKLKRRLEPQAILAMSLQPPGQLLDSAGFAVPSCPTLLLTGTLDSGLPWGVDYRGRMEAYHFFRPGTATLGLLEGADHMSFAGVGLKVKPIVSELERITGQFWDDVWQGKAAPWIAPEAGGVPTYWNEEALCLSRS